MTVDEQSVTEAHPYSDAVVTGGLVFVSGSLPLRPDGVVVGGRAEALAEAVETARRRLATVGAQLEDVVKVTYYLIDITFRRAVLFAMVAAATGEDSRRGVRPTVRSRRRDRYRGAGHVNAPVSRRIGVLGGKGPAARFDDVKGNVLE